jgi:hypothetical protein
MVIHLPYHTRETWLLSLKLPQIYFLIYSANLTIGRIFYIPYNHTSHNIDTVLPIIVLLIGE